LQAEHFVAVAAVHAVHSAEQAKNKQHLAKYNQSFTYAQLITIQSSSFLAVSIIQLSSSYKCVSEKFNFF